MLARGAWKARPRSLWAALSCSRVLPTRRYTHSPTLGRDQSKDEKLEIDQLLRDLDLFSDQGKASTGAAKESGSGAGMGVVSGTVPEAPLGEERPENDLELLFDNVQPDQLETIAEEQTLFKRIFSSYVGAESKDERENQQQSPISFTSILQYDRPSTGSVAGKIREDIFTMTKDALAPTLAAIESMQTSREVTELLLRAVERWLEQETAVMDTQQMLERAEVNKILNTRSRKITANHTRFVQKVQGASNADPLLPMLNVFTLPLLTNQCISRVTALGDGALATTLFNLLKSNLKTYTTCCNQATFNWMLRLTWVYTRDLYRVEKLYFEMVGNGFTGDHHTFHILKTIVLEYHLQKMGPRPVWSRQDDQRVGNLEQKMARLAGQLR